jgi:hypothetical protein
MSATPYTFGGDRIALIVRGKTSADHDPGLMEQHADCALSTGAPMGFFGEASDGGSAGRAPSSFGGSHRASTGKSNGVGLGMAGIVYDLELLRRNRPFYVDVATARGYGVVSTVLLIAVTPTEAAAFDKAWADMKANPGSFQILGWNCSTHASQAFRRAGILANGIPGLDTPNNLYKQLSREKAGKVTSVTGYVGFAVAGGGRFIMTVDTP